MVGWRRAGLFEKALQKTPAEREKGELTELVQGAKNVRVQLKYLREGRQRQQAINQLCIDALTAAKKGESPQAHLDRASAVYRQMEDVAKIEQKVLASLSYEKKPTGDMKKVIDSANGFVTICEQAKAKLAEVKSALMRSRKRRKER
jgi:hypothetical protein